MSDLAVDCHRFEEGDRVIYRVNAKLIVFGGGRGVVVKGNFLTPGYVAVRWDTDTDAMFEAEGPAVVDAEALSWLDAVSWLAALADPPST